MAIPRRQSSLFVELAVAADGQLPTEVRFFRPGLNRTTNGAYLFNAEAAEKVLARAAEWANDYAFDWCHAMLGARYSADPRKAGAAAGYFTLEVRTTPDGPELWATNIRWTEEGADDLRKKRFKYCSPAFWHDDDGLITEIVNCALTAIPATHGADPLVAAREPHHPEAKEHRPMKTLLSLLALKDNATEVEAALALTKMQDDVRGILQATESSSVSECLGKIAGWKVAAQQNAELSKKVAEGEAAVRKAEVRELLEAATKDGRVAPAEMASLTQMGERDVTQLKAYLSVKPKVLPAQAEAPAGDGAKGTTGLSAEQLAVAKLLGKDPAKLAEHIQKFGPMRTEEFASKPADAR